jgi:GPI-anchor transamidase subunit GAA1
VIESTLRTMNNLLERLHASFFFYLMTGPGTFLKIGEFLPSAVIVSVAMMFGGLRVWVDAGWLEQRLPVEKATPGQAIMARWKARRRTVIPPLIIMLVTHVVGGITFTVLTESSFLTWPRVSR